MLFIMTLQGWEIWLRANRPKRIFGELELSEDRFRQILVELKKSRDLRLPPEGLRFITLMAMTFTARFDYYGSFWNAFKNNLGVADLSTPAWGSYFNESLALFDFTKPPQTSRVYVGPVLFHAILPAGCEDELGDI
ncbi:MAG: hypothetical protein GIW96_00635 [Candidatus Eremiobacteraeota bacterium]|nr:hypothetical protein [Candidatus Eremiobacteraeota bacterium]